jgi:protocatechuate 3,4-dioxygenase beta subunit
MNDETKPQWTRRFFVLSAAASAAEFALAKASPASSGCTLDAELTEGPYYLDRGLFRRDITEGKPGVPLTVRARVWDARTCSPIEQAALEIWHCNASGVYSGFTKMGAGGMGGPPPRGPMGPPPDGDPGLGPPPDGMMGPPPEAGRFPGPGRSRETDSTSFCRGIQLSGSNGVAEFQTMSPGWYVGRDTHIHLKVHLGGLAKSGRYHGGRVVHTGQLFFPDELSDEIARFAPYAAHRAPRTILEDDMVFNQAHGAAPMLKLEPLKRDSIVSGFRATVTVRVDPSHG